MGNIRIFRIASQTPTERTNMEQHIDFTPWIQPISIIPNSKEFRRSICMDRLEEITTLQRLKRVQTLKTQMMENNGFIITPTTQNGDKVTDIPHANSITSAIPEFLLEDMADSDMDNEIINLPPVEIGNDDGDYGGNNTTAAPTSYSSTSSESLTSPYNIRYANPHKRETQYQYHLPSTYPLVYQQLLIREEIFWEIRLPVNTASNAFNMQTINISDSKLFFFQNILWRLSFGRNTQDPKYFYLFLSPAEQLKRDCKLKVEFFIHGNDDFNRILPPYSKTPLTNLTFPTDFTVSRGFEKFIGPDLATYISANGRIRLSVVISSNKGPDGDLIGCI